MKNDYKEQCWKRYLENQKYEKYDKVNKEIEEILSSMKEIAECIYTTDWIELNFKDTKLLLSYIEQLEKENQQLKKQKDDVVELIKKPDKIRSYYEYEYYLNDDFKEDLLRMLGEIE